MIFTNYAILVYNLNSEVHQICNNIPASGSNSNMDGVEPLTVLGAIYCLSCSRAPIRLCGWRDLPLSFQQYPATEDQDDEFDFDGGTLCDDLAVEATRTTEATPPVLSTPREVEKTVIHLRALRYSLEKKARSTSCSLGQRVGLVSRLDVLSPPVNNLLNPILR